MDTVTDILEFAAQHADYWTEFLSGQDYSNELSPEETKALDAAREHIEEAIYDLLQACGDGLAERLEDYGIPRKAFQRGATSTNRYVRTDAPEPLTEQLYGFRFELSPDKRNERILLYGSLIVKKKFLDEILARLTKAKETFDVADYYLYGPGIPLERERPFRALAGTASETLAKLFTAAMK